MRIYVAGPYSAPTEAERFANTKRAMDAGVALFRLGHIPFIPHLTHFVEMHCDPKLSYHDYMNWDEEWLAQCHGLVFLGQSPGANVELAHAQRLGLEIFTSLEEVPRL